MTEPSYTNVYDDEDDGMSNVTRGKKYVPKWTIPTTQFQKDFLSIFLNRKVFHNKDERHELIMIEKDMLSLTEGISAYPKEWVYSCINWAKKMWTDNKPIPFPTVIKHIKNNEQKTLFVSRWKKKNPTTFTDDIDPYSQVEKWK